MQKKILNQQILHFGKLNLKYQNPIIEMIIVLKMPKKISKKNLGLRQLRKMTMKYFLEIVLTTEIQYYACDSGHGGNIINDCLNALKEDSPGFSECEYEYRWIKLDYNHFLDETYISWAIELSSYGNIKYNDGILVGDCLGLV